MMREVRCDCDGRGARSEARCGWVGGGTRYIQIVLVLVIKAFYDENSPHIMARELRIENRESKCDFEIVLLCNFEFVTLTQLNMTLTRRIAEES